LPEVKRLFARNKIWAERLKEINPDYFTNLAQQQKPEILWIGCADSRVPANQIIDLPPGEVFVHRNIANVVVHSDLNCLSVLQYAVEVLEVRWVIVCGHYGCGGVRASMMNNDHGLIDNWLNHIRNVQRLHKEELDPLDDHQRERRLCELNVIEQVRNVVETTIMRDAWKTGTGPEVHGWIYSLGDGLLQQLCVQKRDDHEMNLLPKTPAGA
jgi:carbonic anhydrase